MRVSEHYKLGLTQPSLDFLDVDIKKDTRAFVDPHAFRYIQTDWARECVSLLQDFYSEVMAAIRANDRRRGMYLLANLGESNEVHLGLSKGDSEGSGVAAGLASDIWDALVTNDAVQNGLIDDIEETVLFVAGIGHDRVSDMTINIVRHQLIEYTQRMCQQYGIPVVPGLDSGPMWDRRTKAWTAEYTSLPMPNSKLLLIPRAVVRKNSIFDAGEYLQHFVLPHLQRVELDDPTSVLVEERRSKRLRGQKFVTKKSIRKRDGKPAKEWNSEVTQARPDLLESYRTSKVRDTEPPDHDEIAAYAGTPNPDWDALLEAVTSVPSGKDHADDYHHAIQALLTALFYPALDMPNREFRIHDGRKRIDIVYTNLAKSGFFMWLTDRQKVPAGHVFVECKNYTGALSNPEFDQLTGRFSPLRGRFGILCYRGFADSKEKVIARCRDAAMDDRGFVIALDDEDLAALVKSRKDDDERTLFKHLMERFEELL